MRQFRAGDDRLTGVRYGRKMELPDRLIEVDAENERKDIGHAESS